MSSILNVPTLNSEINKKYWIIASSQKRIPGQGEDMLYNDHPTYKGLMLDDQHCQTDTKLFEQFQNLIEWMSVGNNEVIALDMMKRFREKTGGYYRNPALNHSVNYNIEYRQWELTQINQLIGKIRIYEGNLLQIPQDFSLKRLAFVEPASIVSGLGIMIHQVHSSKIEVSDYTCNKQTKQFKGNIRFTLYDHFGLDHEDVIKAQERWFGPPGGECGFKAWYVLQHFRGYRPFITTVEITKSFAGRL